MDRVSYQVTIAGWSIDSAGDPRAELLSLDVSRSLGGADDCCRVTLYAPPAPAPSLLDQAVGAAADAVGGALGLGGDGGGAPAFTTTVRGEAVTHGDPVEVTLTAGDRSAKVMTAEVESVHSTLAHTVVVGRGGLARLAVSRASAVHANRTAKQIAADLAAQAGVTVGDVEDGDTYPYFVVDPARGALESLHDVARLEGMDVYADADGKLVMKKFTKSGGDHTLWYGIDILDLRLVHREAPTARVVVSGESPASNKGASSWHLLAKDLAPFQGAAGPGGGARLVSVYDGAARTKAAAERRAAALLGAVADGSTSGRVTLLGRPDIALGDAVEIKGTPKAEMSGTFKVTSVRHVLGKRAGFVTTLGLSGLGGAERAGGLLGEGAAALAGALGL